MKRFVRPRRHIDPVTFELVLTRVQWDFIADFTGDDSFRADVMREYFIEVENCIYLPEGTPGHGFKGPITVGHLCPTRVERGFPRLTIGCHSITETTSHTSRAGTICSITWLL
jgi:hypothetical protein